MFRRLTLVERFSKSPALFTSGSLAARFFHNWVPGSAFTPIPLDYIDLHKVYREKLENCVGNNLEKLRLMLNISENLSPSKATDSIVKKLMCFDSEEVKSVIRARFASSKYVKTYSKEYSEFLKEMYSHNPCEQRILKALQRFPNGMNSHNFDPSHLETLINFSMKNRELCIKIFEMLQKSGLPTTSREQAMYVYQTFRAGGDWRSALARFWPTILESKDISAFNTLLKLALRARCADTQSLIRYHHRKPDRFTYFIRLRNQPYRSVLREFNEQHFIIDVAIATTVLSSMLNSRSKCEVNIAEEKFEQLLASSRGIKPIYNNPNKLSILLKALDRVSQLLGGKVTISLPQFVDSVLLQRMYAHYICSNNHSGALRVAKAISQHGNILPRHLIYSHIKSASTADSDVLEQLFYLCCDLNTIHPGYISKSLAEVWTSKITLCSGIPREDAFSLVEKCRAALEL